MVFFTNGVYHTDTACLYIETKHWNKLDNAGLIGENLLQGKNDYKGWRIFDGLFPAPKINYCLTINKYGIIDEHKSFKGFTNDSPTNLDRKEYFEIYNGNNFYAKVPLSWKKSFSMGVVIPNITKNCNKCSKDVLCDVCDKLSNQKKEFSANLKELKRQALNQNGHMLPTYETMWFRSLLIIL